MNSCEEAGIHEKDRKTAARVADAVMTDLKDKDIKDFESKARNRKEWKQLESFVSKWPS